MAANSSDAAAADEAMCRVCRGPGTAENALYHPCKCAGSMKYVHQEWLGCHGGAAEGTKPEDGLGAFADSQSFAILCACWGGEAGKGGVRSYYLHTDVVLTTPLLHSLEEWLSHSRKKHCEICNHKFNFTPIYNPHAPPAISLNFFTSVLLRRAWTTAKLYLRILLAGTVWLVLLPYATVWIWRFWFDPSSVFAARGASEQSLLQQKGTFENLSSPSHGAWENASLTSEASHLILVPSYWTPILNFTLEYLLHVASLLGITNGTLFHELHGQYLTMQRGNASAKADADTLTEIGLKGVGMANETDNVMGVMLDSQFQNGMGPVVDWIPVMKTFFMDVFEGQIILSVLIIVAIALLCIKEYVVLNTPVNADGIPINPPDADEPLDLGFAFGGGLNDDPPPPPPAPPRRAPRRQVARANPPAPIPRPRLNPAVPAPLPPVQVPGQFPRTNTAALQRAHQANFERALRDPELPPEALPLLFEAAIANAQTEPERVAVAAAADAALVSARVHEESLRAEARTYKEEAVETLQEAVSASGIGEDGAGAIVQAFEAEVEGLDVEHIQRALQAVLKDLKGFGKKRRGSRPEVASVIDSPRVLRSGRVIGGPSTSAPLKAAADHDGKRVESENNEENRADDYINPVYSRQYVTRPSAPADGSAPRRISPRLNISKGERRGSMKDLALSPPEVGSTSTSGASPFSLTDATPLFGGGSLPGATGDATDFVTLVTGTSTSTAAFGVSDGTSSSAAPNFGRFNDGPDSADELEVGGSSSSGKRKERTDDTEILDQGSPLLHGNEFSANLRSTMHDHAFGGRDEDIEGEGGLGLRQRRPRPFFDVDEHAAVVDRLGDNPFHIPGDIPRLQRRVRPEDLAQLLNNQENANNRPAWPDMPPPQPAAQQPAPRERPPRPPRPPRQRQQPPQQDLLNFNDAFNLNVNVELGPDGIAADVQAQGDINAFMELVGIQGPLDMLVQNFGIAVFIVFAALGGGLWVPFVLGRGILWLFCDVYAPFVGGALSQGTEVLQTFTDPLLDPVVDWLVEVVKWSGLVAAVRNGNYSIVNQLTGVNVTEDSGLTMMVNASVVDNSTERKVDGGVFSPLLEKVLHDVDGDFSKTPRAGLDVLTVSISGVNATGTNETVLHKAKEVLPQRLSFISDRVANILVGYFTIIFVVYHHARRTGRLRHPYVQTLKRMMLKGIRFLYMAFKFSFFITIELGMFPTFCGILIDICTLSVFGPNATIESRIEFYHTYPWSSYFLHWLAGTTFMFQFASYVQSVRKIVRPGVVWFIRDPEDPQFHPMQDILEKPALTQLRKLAVGACMYAIVVVSTMGGFVGLVQAVQSFFGAQSGPAKIWPLKWEFSEPLSEFPIDLLMFHFLVPAVFSWIRPTDMVVEGLRLYYKFAARRLRITQFIFGERQRDEENGEVGDEPIIVRTFNQTMDEAPDASTMEAIAPGARATPYLRVPNHDRIPLKPNQKVMVPISQFGPLVGREGETEEDIRANWTRVYVPEMLRIRLMVLLIFQWLFGLLVSSGLLVGPLYLGRVFFVELQEYFTDPLRPVDGLDVASELVSENAPLFRPAPSPFRRLRLHPLHPTGAATRSSMRQDLPIHDVFSLAVGMLVCIGVVALLLWVQKTIHKVSEFVKLKLTVGNESISIKVWGLFVYFSEWSREKCVKYVSIASKVLFVAFWAVIVIPMLFGLLFEVYIIVPFVGDKLQTRVFFLLQDWALGAIYTKVVHSIVMNAPDTEFRRILVTCRDQIRQGGFERLHIRDLSLKVLFPIVMIASGLLFLPAGAVLFLEYLQSDEVLDETASETVGRLLLPGVFGLFVLYEVAKNGRKAIKGWMDEVRDEHFLVGRRLRNLGDPVPASIQTGLGPIAQAMGAAPPEPAEARDLDSDDDDDIPMMMDEDWIDE
ncbi:hypothetical protein BC830DRAFT_1171635 [Chytriomyces sp. MP71]|nr:hypothetical protein BC830DRAFT_1171635 [Chytriomyces sp. MP71]